MKTVLEVLQIFLSVTILDIRTTDFVEIVDERNLPVIALN
jgi:hypothetical protein